MPAFDSCSPSGSEFCGRDLALRIRPMTVSGQRYFGRPRSKIRLAWRLNVARRMETAKLAGLGVSRLDLIQQLDKAGFVGDYILQTPSLFGTGVTEQAQPVTQ